MAITTMQELFIDELGDIYDAEHRFLEGQQEMAQKATDQDLRSAIQEHIEQTRQHIRKLEREVRHYRDSYSCHWVLSSLP